MKSVNLSSAAIGEKEFPKSMEVEQVNTSLIAQAVRIYRARMRQGNAHTKTRGEVAGSTRKIYKQKGTGRARHGSIKAPVFIGGGTVHGPRSHEFDLEMPVSMRRAATLHALNARKDVLLSMEDVSTFDKGTKVVAQSLQSLTGDMKKSLVVLASADRVGFRTAVRNMKHVITVPVDEVNALDIMKYPHVIVEDQAWELLEKRLKAKGQK